MGLALEAVDLALGLVSALDLGLELGLELDLALELLDSVLEQELGLVLGLEWSQEWGQEQRLDLDLLCLSKGPRTRLGVKLEARPEWEQEQADGLSTSQPELEAQCGSSFGIRQMMAEVLAHALGSRVGAHSQPALGQAMDLVLV